MLPTSRSTHGPCVWHALILALAPLILLWQLSLSLSHPLSFCNCRVQPGSRWVLFLVCKLSQIHFQVYFQLGGAFIFMFRITLAFRRPIIVKYMFGYIFQIHFHYHVQIHIQINFRLIFRFMFRFIFKFMLRFIFKFMCQTHTQAFLVPQSLQIQGGLLDDTQSDSVPMFNLNCLDLNILAAHLACLQTESLLMGWHWFQP